MLFVLLLGANGLAFAASSGGETLLFERAIPKEEQDIRSVLGGDRAGMRADTTWFGQHEMIDGEYYGIPFGNKAEGSWTFDRGTGPIGEPGYLDNGEGWSSVDLTVDIDEYWKVIDNTLDLGGGVIPPVIHGAHSLWVGATQAEADALCWECGAGYGNDWCQRLVSEDLVYDGSGSVTFEFSYWSFSEPCFDGVQLYLIRDDNSALMLNPYPAGECEGNLDYVGGTIQDSIGAYDEPATYSREITAEEIGGAQTVRLIFEFFSDAGWSDEDCIYPTEQGPFGADDVSISGAGIEDKFYDFEDGTFQGWTPGICHPVGDYVDIVDLGCGYEILDPCSCRLEGNVMEMHAEECGAGVHPVEQNAYALGPICDVEGALGEGLKTIFMEFDMYAELPMENGVMIRPGWFYYPWECEVTGTIGWSERVGQNSFNFFGADPVCATWRYGGTEINSGTPVPAEAQMVRPLIEILGDCEAFAIDPCSGITNFTPLFDNLTVGVTDGVDAPVFDYTLGGTYQDTGSWPSDLFDPRAEAPANATRDIHMDTTPGESPDLLGDSLSVSGPIPGSDPNTRWEAKLWFRVAKRGPFQVDRENGAESRYKIWKDRVSDGKKIDRPDHPQFAWAYMDSVQLGVIVKRNQFFSEFREDDDDFVGELMPENEIIWDDALRPGTRIEYFVTSNYAHTPSHYYFAPDTSGGFFQEFEVLPGIRTANVPNCGGTGFDFCVYQPATLYINAFNGNNPRMFIENALSTVLNGRDPCEDPAGCEIPSDRNWDRYDYRDASSNWNAPFVRGSVSGSNNGMTLNQILGYRAIMVNTAIYDSGSMQDEDFALFDQWLFSPDCSSNVHRQVFLMNGDKTGEILERPGGQDIEFHGAAFLNGVFGATLLCDAFNGITDDPDCGDENESYCVQWLPVGGAFPTETDIDLYGNFCPNVYGFNVFNPDGGSGNRFYSAEDGLKDMAFGQITNENLASGANFRTVLDGASWYHMTSRTLGDPDDVCPRDIPSIVSGSLSEIGAELKWGFGAADYSGIPKLTNVEELAGCQGTWDFPSDADDGPVRLVTRLFQNQPNPFNPRTTIRFSLSQAGPVELLIYDVNGRAVKRLVEGNQKAGTHSVVWDGTNDSGQKVGSGVYWSQMRTASFESNKKMVILK